MAHDENYNYQIVMATLRCSHGTATREEFLMVAADVAERAAQLQRDMAALGLDAEGAQFHNACKLIADAIARNYAADMTVSDLNRRNSAIRTAVFDLLQSARYLVNILEERDGGKNAIFIFQRLGALNTALNVPEYI